MASIKELRLRIRSLKNTNKITAAMKLVASSKLRRAQEAMASSRPYAAGLDGILSRIAANSSEQHPLMEQRPLRKVLLYVATSDKGLCGAFNNRAIRAATDFIAEQPSGVAVEVRTLGKKAADYFSRRPDKYTFGKHHTEVARTPRFDLIAPIADEAIDAFALKSFDAVFIIYNRFESVLRQEPQVHRVLPAIPKVAVAPTETHSAVAGNAKQESGLMANYLFEPGPEELLGELLPAFVRFHFYQAMLENSAGEHGARMTAMDNATNNSADLIQRLTLVMNRARQAAITTELTEIVSGAESLKG
jgi:F-type H+-transporting ATPase subunit gamma